MKPEILDDLAVAARLDFTSVRCVLDEALADLAHGRAQVLGRERIACGGLRFAAMGGIWGARGVAGSKSYPTVDGRFSFMVSLFDLVHNRPLAVLAGAELTRMRTAGLAALVASRAAPPRPCSLALVGAGVQGRSIAQAVAEAMPLEHVAVADPAFPAGEVDSFAARLGVPVSLCPAEHAVREADLVVTATRSKTPVIDGDWLRPGTLVLAFGTSTPDGSELDERTLRRTGRMIVEWKPQSLREAGELVLARERGALAQEQIVDLAELYRGGAAWREKPEDIVVFKSVGIGLADVATAWLALQRGGAAVAGVPAVLQAGRSA